MEKPNQQNYEIITEASQHTIDPSYTLQVISVMEFGENIPGMRVNQLVM
jgi:hypothetical protein